MRHLKGYALMGEELKLPRQSGETIRAYVDRIYTKLKEMHPSLPCPREYELIDRTRSCKNETLLSFACAMGGCETCWKSALTQVSTVPLEAAGGAE